MDHICDKCGNLKDSFDRLQKLETLIDDLEFVTKGARIVSNKKLESLIAQMKAEV
jgi:hypothetical protein